MSPSLPRHRRRNVLTGILLALSLLFTQWLGYAHAFAHAGGHAGWVQDTSRATDSPFDHSKSASACAAFDAATLGAGLQPDAPALPPAVSPGDAVAAQPCASWHPSFTAHFPTRAPPTTA